MKKYRYIIIDDDDMDRLITSFHLKKCNFLEHLASFSDPAMGLEFLKKNDVEVIFLDIDMPGISGLELIKKIDTKSICTVFITSHPEFALEGFDNEAFDYIIKPLKKNRIAKCTERLEEYLNLKLKAELFENSYNEDSVAIKIGNKSLMIKINDIAYLEALKDYTKIVNHNGKKTIIYGNLGKILQQEIFTDFIRIHKSYAIHKRYISEINTTEITLINNIVLPLSKSYTEYLYHALNNNG